MLLLPRRSSKGHVDRNIDAIPMGSSEKTGNGSMTRGHPSCYGVKDWGTILSDCVRSGGVTPGTGSAPACLRVIVSASPHAYTVEMY